jgi:hypothetical protein
VEVGSDAVRCDGGDADHGPRVDGRAAVPFARSMDSIESYWKCG